MHRRLVALSAAAVLGTGVTLESEAQPFTRGPEPIPCVAPGTAPADVRVAEKIADVDRNVGSGRAGVWTALADLAEHACRVTGDRLPVDAAFRHCIRDCTDDRDVYFAHVLYAEVLERLGDPFGAENQYLRALQRRVDPENAYFAFMSYALMLERQRRTRDALDVLNRYAAEASYRAPVHRLRMSLMTELGMDTAAEEEAAAQRSESDLARMRTDSPPLSAVPVERSPLAQRPFGTTIEVVGNAWIEPAADGAAPGSGRLYYRRASMPDPATFERHVALAPGDRFFEVAELDVAGCRVVIGDGRYDLDDCPWRSGRADAYLFRIVEERVPMPPPLRLRLISPVTGQPVDAPPPPDTAVR